MSITDEKQRVRQRMNEDDRFCELVSYIEDVVWVAEFQPQRRLHISPACRRLWGFEPAAAAAGSQPWVDRIYPADRERVVREFEKMVTGRALDVEYRIRSADNSLRWLRERAFPIRSARNVVVRAVGIAEDITDRKRQERALAEREKHLSLALSAARLHPWTVDIQTREITMDDELRTLLAISPEYRDDRQLWRRRIHPADRIRVARSFRGLLRGHDFDLECRVITPNGGIKWMEVHAVADRDDFSGVQRIYGVAADVTETKHAAQVIAASEQQLRLITDAAPVFIARCDRGLHYRFVNKAYAEWLGGVPEDFQGKSVEAALGPTGWRKVRPYVERVLSGDRLSYEIQLAGRLGVRFIHCEYVPDINAEGDVVGWIEVASDITERKKAEKAQYEREREFKTLVENSPDIIARIDRDMRHVYINRAVVTAFGIPAADYIGRTKGELGFPAKVAAAHDEAAKTAFQTGEEQSFEFDLELEGRRRKYVVRVIPEPDRSGRIESILMITYDITLRDEAERERDALLVREKAARAQAEAAARARDQFLAVVSHELRSPLNGIQSWTHVLENQLPASAPIVQRALDGIKLGVKQQVRLIDDLLDVTLVVSGRFRLVKQPVALREVIEAALQSIRGNAAEKSQTLHTDIKLSAERVDGDPDRLQQIMWNLLSNAIKFTPEHGEIWLSAEIADGRAIIKVRDTGKGITADFLPHLFDPFRQADGSNTRRASGIGLGLTLVKRLTELHGGHVEAFSQGERQGATFVVDLPLAGNTPDMRALEEPPPGSLIDVPKLSLRGTRILLVDDQPEARESLSALLTQAGATVQCAESGAAALELLEQAGPRHRPDVLICDIAMPGEDGYITLQKVRGWETRNHVPPSRKLPAIALTAFAQQEDRIRALASGFQMHLAKPVMPAELIVVIATVSGR